MGESPERVEFKALLANLDVTPLPDWAIARLADGEHPLSLLASATPELRVGGARVRLARARHDPSPQHGRHGGARRSPPAVWRVLMIRGTDRVPALLDVA